MKETAFPLSEGVLAITLLPLVLILGVMFLVGTLAKDSNHKGILSKLKEKENQLNEKEHKLKKLEATILRGR